MYCGSVPGMPCPTTDVRYEARRRRGDGGDGDGDRYELVKRRWAIDATATDGTRCPMGCQGVPSSCVRELLVLAVR